MLDIILLGPISTDKFIWNAGYFVYYTELKLLSLSI